MMDWNLKTNLDGLYVAGTQLLGGQDHSYCAATGRYAGRKAAAYVKATSQGESPVIRYKRKKTGFMHLPAGTAALSGRNFTQVLPG